MTTERHDESSCQGDVSVPDGDGDRCVGRRSYLKLAGATAGRPRYWVGRPALEQRGPATLSRGG